FAPTVHPSAGGCLHRPERWHELARRTWRQAHPSRFLLQPAHPWPGRIRSCLLTACIRATTTSVAQIVPTTTIDIASQCPLVGRGRGMEGQVEGHPDAARI